MRYTTIFLAMLSVTMFGQRFVGDTTKTYFSLIANYTSLANQYDKATLFEMGPTDAGRPLHLFVFSKDGVSSMDDVKNQVNTHTVLFINNGIHAGESCGIDASLLFVKHLLETNKIPKNVLIAVVPVYNVGGMLNRNTHSRANQIGPREHGFRGNAQNLDLNRDFIKADALNTKSFYALFHLLKPHLFVDTHTSNGADYQYTMTLISTQKDKLNPILADFLLNDLEPTLYQSMKQKNWKMTPYVNVFGSTPNQGMSAFLETPRYASGYTALFNTIGFITETHMLKPYADRVNSTLAFLETIAEQASLQSKKIMDVKKRAQAYDLAQTQFAVNWTLDSSEFKILDFDGYKYSFEESAIHKGKRLKYHQNKPQTFEVNYYNTYTPIEIATVPEYYIVPAAYNKVPVLLQYNDIDMKPLKRDTIIEVKSWYVKDYEFSNTPYEGHFPLKNLKVEEQLTKRLFLKGDWMVYTNQKNKRFIVNTLHPTAVDAYLHWNFYDAIFQQKEWFSAYVFEDTAEELLKTNPVIQEKYKAWRKEHPNSNGFESLYFIYKNSPYYEPEHLRYPVAASTK